MFRWSSGDLYSIMLCCRKILPIFFLIFTFFSFLTNTSICIGFFESKCSGSKVRYFASSPSSICNAASNAGCHWMFPLYHNRICCDFQRIRSIFYVKNITRNSESICIAVLHQNGISCRTGCERWDYILPPQIGFGFADKKK